jgi:hypothetical protein
LKNKVLDFHTIICYFILFQKSAYLSFLFWICILLLCICYCVGFRGSFLSSENRVKRVLDAFLHSCFPFLKFSRVYPSFPRFVPSYGWYALILTSDPEFLTSGPASPIIHQPISMLTPPQPNGGPARPPFQASTPQPP